MGCQILISDIYVYQVVICRNYCIIGQIENLSLSDAFTSFKS